jgi:ABC-type dipeptide/oligopeptide/nickel transport system permease component
VALYIIKRTASFVVTLVAASLFIYFMLNLLGGDPAAAMLGDDANAADIAAIRERLGLNRPWYVQYFEWISGFFTGRPRCIDHHRPGDRTDPVAAGGPSPSHWPSSAA